MSDTEQTQTPQRLVRTPGRGATPAKQQMPQAAAAAVDLPEDTPNAIDIDPKTLKGPVLTRQGWVCPDTSEREQRGLR